MTLAVCWSFLILSVFLGVGGISLMKAASHGSWAVAGILAMYVMLGLAYYSRSKAVVKIPVAVAYAIYEVGGLALMAVVGFFALGEALSSIRLAGMALLVLGTVLIHRGIDAGREG